MRPIIYGAPCVAAALFLAACGGGGSSGPPAQDAREIHDTISSVAARANSQVFVEKVYQGQPAHWGGPYEPGRRAESLPRHVHIPETFRSRGVRGGVSLAESHERDRPFPGERTDNFALGGWLEHNYFIVERAQIWFDDPAEDDHLEAFADSIGSATGSSPVPTTWTWEGVVAGYDLSTRAGALIEGDVLIELHSDQHTEAPGGPSLAYINVGFTGLRDRSGGSRPNMIWTDLEVVDGVFRDSTLRGQFYGPNHEEAGGVFYRNQIAGAFGAARQ